MVQLWPMGSSLPIPVLHGTIKEQLWQNQMYTSTGLRPDLDFSWTTRAILAECNDSLWSEWQWNWLISLWKPISHSYSGCHHGTAGGESLKGTFLSWYARKKHYHCSNVVDKSKITGTSATICEQKSPTKNTHSRLQKWFGRLTPFLC